MPPPDEGRRVALYTAVGVAVSFVIFATMRMFAKPAPRTMSKEYQEASNEYLKVREAAASRCPSWREPILTFARRAKTPSLLPVFPRPITRARVWFSRLPSTKAVVGILCHGR